MADIELPEIDINANDDLATNVIRFAMTQNGVQEQPKGSNRGPEVDEYVKYVGIDPAQQIPWCACFVSFCIGKTATALGISAQFHSSAGAMNLLAKNPSLVVPVVVVPCVGVIDHGQGKGHAFFITAINDDGSYQDIEGNSNSGGSREGFEVVVRQRQPAEITGGFIKIC